MQKPRCHFIVLTGGPGAGKTAVMEAARQIFHQEIILLPEAASIVYSGGFPRNPTLTGIRAAQRAIFRVQEELERLVIEENKAMVALCDRGILDGAAYWPSEGPSFNESIGMSDKEILSRYDTIIHVKTPPLNMGYNYANPMRIESPEEAFQLDARIEKAWKNHPNRFVVEATEKFTDKVEHVTALIRAAIQTATKERIQAREIYLQ